MLSFCQPKGFSCRFSFSFPFLLTATFCLSFSDASLVSSQKKTSSVIWPRRQTKTPPPSCSTEPRGGGGGGGRGGGLPAQQQLALIRRQDRRRRAPAAGLPRLLWWGEGRQRRPGLPAVRAASSEQRGADPADPAVRSALEAPRPDPALSGPAEGPAVPVSEGVPLN